MGVANEIEKLYKDIYECRKCSNVVPGLAARQVNETSCRSAIALMVQAPSEAGARKSGLHWVDEDGRFGHKGGTFLDKYLRRLGYSIDPAATGYSTPYTTSVLHCRSGQRGKRHSKPPVNALRSCRSWWEKEFEIVRPQVVILLGQQAAESFDAICGQSRSFKELLHKQGENVTIGAVSVSRYVVPHPSAPYLCKAQIYDEVIESVGRHDG